MEYDESRTYTALNADKLKIGSKVICAFTTFELKKRVDEGERITEVFKILPDSMEHRIDVYLDEGYFSYPLAYLVAEPEEKVLKWTDLKLGDVIQTKDRKVQRMITGIFEEGGDCNLHIEAGVPLSDEYLSEWEKVEE